jgi:CubicO group peptidase (beta-lactamase class C family)
MHRRKFLKETSLTALGACVLTHGAEDGEKQNVALISEVEKRIPKVMKEAVIPGVSIALVRGGKVLWTRGFGVKDSASKEPVDDDTLFEAASVSKTVFAYAVMKLCEKGVLELDTPLVKYAPTLFEGNDPRLVLITPRHALAHTTGFKDWRTGPLKIEFNPGEKFEYSGEGYFYLQSVVTHLTGQVDRKASGKYEADFEVYSTDIDSYLKRNLLRPFGMASSGYVWNETFAKNAARPHDSNGKPLKKAKPSAVDAARYASAGGLHTTAREYASFLIEIVDPKESDTFRLTKKSLHEMLRPQIKFDKNMKIDGADSWALGWAVQERKSGHVIVHSGGQTGFRSLAMASPGRKSGFIILTNGDKGGKLTYDPDLGELLNQVLEQPA